jgi:NAD(P)-dependent dehydrogenase (short-subunit alcohol dehydrogenase family)
MQSWRCSVKLDGARCLVTGCSSGIGRATALALAGAGAHVLATARTRGSIADVVLERLRIAELDVTDDAAVRRVVAASGPFDIVVNNAGYGLEGAIEEVADDELLAQYDTNVFGVWRVCRAALPGMREQRRGAIVNISSFGGQAPFPGIGAYRSSKFAVEGLTWTLHLEVAHFGIRVLSVQPGLVDTDFGTRSFKRARAIGPHGPYEEMRAAAAPAYERMSPTALSPASVADAITAELRKDSGPLRLRIGDDAKRMTDAAEAGPPAYESMLIEQLGFDWHPRSRKSASPSSRATP